MIIGYLLMVAVPGKGFGYPLFEPDFVIMILSKQGFFEPSDQLKLLANLLTC